VAGLFAPEQMRLARDGYLQTHRQWLTEQAGLMSKHAVEVTSEVVGVQHPYEEILHFVNEMTLALIEGLPLNSICEFAADHHTDVIVMGTVQHKGLNQLLGTTAEQLLHRAPCSVLAIKPGRMLQS
jgi:nucleotide-binding universal stress UspA family protein